MWTRVAVCVVAMGCAKRAAPRPVAEPTNEAPRSTCQDLAARAEADLRRDLPAGMRQDLPARFGAVLRTRCAEDAWAQDVIDCGMSADDPKAECRPLLTPEQQASLDAAQEAFARAMMAELATQGDVAPIPECVSFAAEAERLAACDKLPDDTRAGFAQVSKAITAATPSDEAQRASLAADCTQGLGGLAKVAQAYGC